MPEQDHITERGYPIFTGYRISGCYDRFMYEEPMLIVVARGVGGTGNIKISPPQSFITNLAIIFLLNDPELYIYYLYHLFQIQNLRYLDSGAAQSQITIEDLQTIRVIIPNDNLLKKFNDMYSVIACELNILEEHNTNLKKQRDLLLPRLMSGKLEV